MFGHEDGTVILPWLGGRQLNVVRLLVQAEGIPCWVVHPMALQAGAPPDRLKDVLRTLAEAEWPSLEDLAAGSGEDMRRAKYDAHLPERVLARDWASEFLDPAGVREALGWLAET
jgi:hypothetical protein